MGRGLVDGQVIGGQGKGVGDTGGLGGKMRRGGGKRRNTERMSGQMQRCGSGESGW